MVILSEAMALGMPGQFDTVLHIGAGLDAFDVHAALVARRRVLVEGDPDVLADLRADARAASSAAELWDAVAAPESGELTWLRYTVRSLNGPLPLPGLADVYPRLRQWGQITRTATALAQLVYRALGEETPDSQRQHLLVLDVPGQEAGLLRSLDTALLHRFSWIVVRGGRRAYGPGWGSVEQAADLLRSHHFRASASAPNSGLWATVAFERDSASLERHQAQESQRALERQCQDAAEALAHCQTQRAALQDKAAHLERQLAGAETRLHEADRSAAECAAELERQRHRHQEDVAGLQQAMNLAKAELGALAERHDDQLQQLTAERDEARLQARDALAEVQRMRARLAEITETVEAAQRERDQLRATSGVELESRKAAEQAAAEWRAALDELQKKADWRNQQIQKLQQELAEARRDGGECATRLANGEQARAALETKQRELERSAAAADDQIARLQRELAEANQAAARKDADAKAAAEDAAAARASAQQVEKDSKLRCSALEDEITQLRLRQRLLDEEMAKAEGQIELIKDVLLREPGL